ncbi:hypothetical protein jhhlp_007312 [Lomentospora prolificans]|uniref:PH domain-containing protein n=1 Tax=Lomentospora prolificans TaxID=41688 RepID=A0A2N3N2B4_9PEZI|nr:hypothetical protein jhhlp_007312 [Lomentospora prolificans]
MVQAYQPPLMDIGQDIIPELQPIFTFLNGHGNKLYQEGYFLKLDDQNTQGRPNPDRTWTECFAQLVGTVLSLWDAAELDAAGDDGEVLPKFINLTDASIKMIESLPTRSNDEQPLQNILSISTAGRNRYLLHFNSHDTLIEWTASIRLAMFEHASLQEAYTGALIAGKGKSLNNINIIMERMRLKNEAWVRVRFGAGVPWRRCWCVITPPDEKEYQKLQKELKKRSPYDRSHIPILKGDIKFYDTKKEGKRQKKARPIATITDAYSAYGIYPQAKSLIDASTLLKIEGNITIHSDPPSSTEGFVFVMPETHPAVSGFEMLLRFLFPTWDTFGLYGRPGRLVASTLDPRSLMFAMPKHRRYGYLDTLDVSQLIVMDGSKAWTEREWRKRLKDLTGQRMNEWDDSEKLHQRSSSRRSNRLSFGMGANGNSPPRPRAVGFTDDSGSVRSFSPNQQQANGPLMAYDTERPAPAYSHARNSSDPQPGSGPPLAAPVMNMPFNNNSTGHVLQKSRVDGTHYTPPATSPDTTSSSDDDHGARNTPLQELEGMRQMNTPEPVSRPPVLHHGANARPAGGKAYHSPEMRRANSRLSNTTLSQLAKAGGLDFAPEGNQDGPYRGNGEANAEPRQLVHPNINPVGDFANQNQSREAMIPQMSPPGANPDFSRAQSHARMNPPHQEPRRNTEPRDGNLGSPRHPGFGGDLDSRPPPGPLPQQPMQRPYAGSYRPSTPPLKDGGRPGPVQGRSALQNEMMSPINTSPPSHRKPVPGRIEAVQAEASPISASSSDSFRGNMIDPAILDQIRSHDVADKNSPRLEQGIYQRQDSFRSAASSSAYTGTRVDNTPHMPSGDMPIHNRGPPPPMWNPQRQNSSKSSQYSDGDSAMTPDYASTRKSNDTARSVERPRAGVLKTVGGGGAPPMPTRAGDDYSIPDIDFGPTVPHDAQRKNPPASTPQSQQLSQQRPPMAPLHRKSPSGERSHSRQESSDTLRRSVVWQPGAAVVGKGDQGMSVEEYVQHRAVAAATPVISHARTPSGNLPGSGRSTTPTPSMARTISGDALASRHSRSSSADLLQRPSSQGAGTALGYGSAGEVSSNLSARELEHVARVTGSPLINMAGNKPAQHGTGLVGAIEAREREKQQIKHGVNSQAVQYAINQRQQQQQQQRYHQQQNMGVPPPQGMYQGMSFGPTLQQGWQPQFQQGPQFQQPYGYGGGAGNMNPPMMGGPPPQGAGGYARPPGPRVPTGRQSPAQDPRMMGPTGGVYNGAPPSQGGRGYIHQGQAF